MPSKKLINYCINPASRYHLEADLAALGAIAASITVTGILVHSENRRFQAQERAIVLNQSSTLRA